MASSSGGVEWAQLVKPILAASYGSVNKQDLPELVKAIVKRLVFFKVLPKVCIKLKSIFLNTCLLSVET